MEIKELKQKFIELYGGSESDLRVFSAAGRANTSITAAARFFRQRSICAPLSLPVSTAKT